MDCVKKPEKSSQSAFLVSQALIRHPNLAGRLRGKNMAGYLKKLLKDPDLGKKLNMLKPSKWKKHYQSEGLDLVPLYFYPDEVDWAHLSLISHTSGFSRCYIFVFLMLFDIGYLKLPKNKTLFFPRNLKLSPSKRGLILLNIEKEILNRHLRL